jgi:oxygen-independent coproporphyrinogen-3 oxidase
MEQLIKKYNVPGPRYTSYPTVPFWKNDQLSENEWIDSINTNYNFFQSSDVSVYIHLPFCESLCTFCGCHKRITKNHAVETPYLEAVLKEWSLYLEKLPFQPTIKELHFGGGTPTFFSAQNLKTLVEEIFQAKSIDPASVELSFEAHPNNTSSEQLTELYNFGFRRLSLGIQDYSPIVQQAIHRIQSFEQVKKVHDEARKIGYTSISHDLVFGLPKQTLEAIIDTVNKTLELKPDRISLYSYAHVPWIKGNGQRGFNENDLPQSEVKRALYEKAKQMLEINGYKEIGMDHFALDHDDLAKAFQEKKLHRNFMGYTTKATSSMIGLGMSAISDSWFGFAQNDKTVEGYIALLEENKLPIFRGHLLSDLEVEIRGYILDLMCHFETTFSATSNYQHIHDEIKDKLSDLINDGLVEVQGAKVIVTEKGIPFVRNCCMAFDQDLKNHPISERLFSKTI